MATHPKAFEQMPTDGIHSRLQEWESYPSLQNSLRVKPVTNALGMLPLPLYSGHFQDTSKSLPAGCAG